MSDFSEPGNEFEKMSNTGELEQAGERSLIIADR
jgi:hypothetical protein